MPKNLKVKFLLISALVVFCVWVIYPIQEKINLGLDLQGGIFLTLQVDMSKLPKNIKEDVRSDIVDRTIEIIRKRVDQFGVKEPSITRQEKTGSLFSCPGLRTESGPAHLSEKQLSLSSGS